MDRFNRYIGIFLISAATLLLELSLTRILSITFFYHFGFLIISTALLGFGIAGTVLSVSRKLQERPEINSLLTWLSCGFALMTVLSYILSQQISFNPFQLFEDYTQVFLFPVYYLLLVTPFFFSGLIISLLFTHHPMYINKLYAWDLVGAGLGCGLVAGIMPLVGGVGAIFISAAIGLLAAFAFGYVQYPKISFSFLILAGGLFIFSGHSEAMFPIYVTQGKGGEEGKKTIFTKWNTMSKIDVVEMGPGERSPRYPDSVRVIIFDAGTAATEILDGRPEIGKYLNQLKSKATLDDTLRMFSSPAFVGKSHARVLIIGSGGGEEVVHSLFYNAARVDAVEINPIINRLVTEDMAAYAGYLHRQPNVHFITEDARTFIDGSKEKYDIIISTFTISKAAIASGAMSLAEDYVLTKEAFEQYWEHLEDDGVIFFSRPESDLPRFVTTVRSIMEERGLKDFKNHFIIFSNGFLFKKSPYTAAELNQVSRVSGVNQPNKGPQAKLVYSPTGGNSDNIYHQILTTKNLKNIYNTFPIKIEPATDDQPFFSHKFRWASLNTSLLKETFGFKEDLWQNLNDKPIAEFLLLILLVQTTLIAAVMIFFPLIRRTHQRRFNKQSVAHLLYFSGLGLGFIMLEMAWLQKYQLYIGQPIYTYAVVLGSLLIFTGVGAYTSKRLYPLRSYSISFLFGAIGLLLLSYNFFLPGLFYQTLHLSLTLRLFLAAFSIFPLGFLLGMPFPLGLSMLAEQKDLIPWAWGVNSFFTVIGTIIALIIGMGLGFKWVLLVAGCCYIIAWILALTLITVKQIPAQNKIA